MQPLPPVARLPLLFLGMLALVVGVLAGLARFAVDVPALAAAQAGTHGALMITAFLGTVIGLERAVALAGGGRNWPYLAPLCAGAGGIALLLGLPAAAGQILFVVAGAILAFGSGLLVYRQPAVYLATLALGAVTWLGGNLVWLAGGNLLPAVPWWMAFLVLTIAGERLELTRFLPTPAGARRLFVALVAAQLAALVLGLFREEAGLRLFAATLLALALWLLRYDIARRTVRQTGLTRYIAVCLLAGYAWLALGGLMGLAGGFAPGHPLRDAALHAVFLGFVFSMIFGHAPIIFPAVVQVQIPYHPAFYLPFALLHASLLARIGGGFAGITSLGRAGAVANAVALLLFIVTVLSRVLKRRHAAGPG